MEHSKYLEQERAEADLRYQLWSALVELYKTNPAILNGDLKEFVKEYNPNWDIIQKERKNG